MSDIHDHIRDLEIMVEAQRKALLAINQQGVRIQHAFLHTPDYLAVWEALGAVGDALRLREPVLKAAGQTPPAPVSDGAALRDAAAEVLTYVQGELPAQGWLRDNPGSRSALGRLRAALSTAKEGE